MPRNSLNCLMPRNGGLPWNGRLLACAALALLTVGCPRPVSTQMRTRGQIGPHDDQAVQIADGSGGEAAVYVCPWLVSMNGKEFKTGDIKDGETDGAFGPMVPCGAVITQRGLCPSCKNPVHLPGEAQLAVCPNLYIPEPGVAPSDGALLVDKIAVPCDQILGDASSFNQTCPKCSPTFTYYKDGAPRVADPRLSAEAVPAFRSPYAPDKVIDPVSLMQRGDEAPSEGKTLARNEINQCPTTKRYFELEPSDVIEVIDYAEQVVEPQKESPVDPTFNWSPVAPGTYRNVDDVVGPCWRCGGIGQCPDCNGSGTSPNGTYGTLPPDCWACTRPTKDGARSTGRCPECDGTGFATYTGSLPPSFTYFTIREGNPVAADSKARKWEHPARSGGEDAPAPSDE